MKKIFISAAFSLIFLMITAFTYSTSKTKKVDPKTESEILELVYTILKSRHINPKKIDDDFSKKMFITYLDSIDNKKVFLLQSDIDEFKKYETKLDDQLKENDLTFFFMTYDRIMLRMKESKEMYTNILKNKLDFTINEDARFFENSDIILKTSFAKNKTEQQKNWSNFLKSIVINECKKNFFAGNPKSFNEILVDIYSNFATYLESTNLDYNNTNREQVLQHYINAILVQFDPHSKYYNPLNRDKYINKQTGKITGAGITIMLSNGFLQIKKLAEGGPAYKTKKFAIGDIILKVGEENEYPNNVTGFSIYDVTKLLKGKQGTIVKITIKKANGKIEEIPLKREIVSMNDNYIKSCLIKKNKTTYALLSFQKFYNDFDDEKARNAADDFATELEILKQANAKGLIIDLRGNVGGSVEAAVKIVGNFLNKSPVVQLKGKDNVLTTLQSDNLKKNWDKKVILLVNGKTASAAEIIASTFQEYNIGIVLGEQTFGKGTMQEFQDLNVYKPAKIGNKDTGALNISTLKFYKLNGKSIQKIGVTPDIEFVKNNKLEHESANIGALIPDEVKPVKYNLTNDESLYNTIIKNSKERTSKSQIFKLSQIIDIEILKTEKNLFNMRSLNPEKYLKFFDDLEKNNTTMQIPVFDNTREFTLTTSGQKEVQAKPYLLQKRNKWLEDLKTDYQVDESINILEDMRFLK